MCYQFWQIAGAVSDVYVFYKRVRTKNVNATVPTEEWENESKKERKNDEIPFPKRIIEMCK